MTPYIRTYTRLVSGLGPWSDAARLPRAVACRSFLIYARGSEGQAVEALVYSPTDRQPIGSYLISHGLNPRGPEDDRCDRFARILAHAGFLVMCPRLDALTRMRLDASAVSQLSRSVEALIALGEHPSGTLPGIFSISFGSFPALMTAASPSVADSIGGLVVFGGYADFVETCRFMMGTARRSHDGKPDPTCMAGLAINTAGVLFDGDGGRQLERAWQQFVSAVWGESEMRQRERFSEIAHELSAELPEGLRQIFLQGCGVLPGFAEWVEKGLACIDVQAMDPRAHLHRIHCPVHLFHGRSDDVIPYTQAMVLAQGLCNAEHETYITGLYDHSQGKPGSIALTQLPALFGEAKTMLRMVHAMVLSGTRSAKPRSREPEGTAPPTLPTEIELMLSPRGAPGATRL